MGTKEIGINSLLARLLCKPSPPKVFEVDCPADGRLRSFMREKYDRVLVDEVQIGKDGSFLSRTSGWRVVRGRHLRATEVVSSKTEGKTTRRVATQRLRLTALGRGVHSLESRLSRKR